MKPAPFLIATAIVAALVLSPMVSAAGSITFSSPTSGSSFKDSQSYSIAGTVSPIPGQADSAFISVKNPSGVTVDAGSVAVNPSTGGFTYSTAVGGSASWVTGTYTITATDSYGATGSTTFSYTATVVVSYNVTKALIDIQGNPTQIKSALSTLQANEAASEATEQSDMKGNFTALNTALSSLTSQVGTISTNLGTVQTDVTNMQGQLTTISNNIATLNTAVQAAQTAATNAQTAAQNANNAVSSTQTYVLVVAVLAAITLVLELAILVRKLS